MLKKIFTDKKGFTLIEMIIAVAVSVIIIGTISSMVIYAYKSYYNTDKTGTVLNGVNSVTEAVRELTFNAVEVEIKDVVSEPDIEEGCTAIYCIDNKIYIDGGVIQSAKGLNLSRLDLTFELDTNRETDGKYKTVKYILTANDENGNQAIEPQNLSLFFNNCDAGVVGTSGNCIIVKRGTA